MKNKIPPKIIIGIPINAPIPVIDTIVPMIIFVKPIAFREGFQNRGKMKNPRNPKKPKIIEAESYESYESYE